MGLVVLPYQIYDSGYRGACPKEDIEQIKSADWLSYHMPWVNAFHVPNEIKASVQYGEKRKRMGVKGGVSDWIILTPGLNHPFAVPEMKRLDKTKSKISAEQKKFLSSSADCGGFSCVCYGAEMFKKSMRIYFTGVDNEDIFNAYLAHKLARYNERIER